MNTTINTVNLNVHPEYTYWNEYWSQMYDTVELGEKQIKAKSDFYLPKTEGQEKDASGNKYEAFKKRATYRNFGKITIRKALGLLHSKAYKYTLPNKLKYLEKKATLHNDDLNSLIRDINKEQLTYSRCGLLIDMPKNETYKAEPYIERYKPYKIIDWYEGDYGLNTYGTPIRQLAYVKLDESGNVFNFEDKSWSFKNKYRVLALALYQDNQLLDSPKYYTFTFTDENIFKGIDLQNIYTKDIEAGDIIIPTISGKALNQIPFVFINATHTDSRIEMPVLYEQSNISLAYYRGDANYRQALHYQVFALLYLIGFEEKDFENGVNADGYIATTNPSAKAGYAQISGAGIQAMQLSQNDLKREANEEGIVITDKEGVESGKALTTRMALQTSNLTEIAETCAEGITKVLRIISEWMGIDEEIKIIPNTDFKLEVEKAQELVNVTQVYNLGNMTKIDYYNWQKDNNFTNLSWEEFDKEIDNAIIEDTENVVDKEDDDSAK